ncbi:MAG: hypothetical protein IKH13_07405, partial [Clostridia bacterium]|nr:hypothetical protein [Clostridia bacterium]
YTDIYAVCATMYKMLTGTTPAESLERLDGEDELRDISELAQLPQAAAAAVMKGMALSAADRFQSAEELLAELTKEAPEETGQEQKPVVKAVPDDGDDTKTLLTENASETVAPEEESGEKEEKTNTQRQKSGMQNNRPHTKEKKEAKTEKPASKRKLIICVAAVLAVLVGGIAGFVSTRRQDSDVAGKALNDEINSEETLHEDNTDEKAETITFPLPDGTKTGITTTAKTTEVKTTKRKIDITACKAAYKEFLLNYIKENGIEDSGEDTPKFALIYLDDDDIPELVIPEGHIHFAACSLYCFDGKEVKHLGEYGSWGGFSYRPESGYFFSGFFGQGVSSSYYYKFENNSVTEIAYFREEPKKMDSDWDDPESFNYYIGDDQVSYSEYKEKEEKIRKEVDADKAIGTTSQENHFLTKESINAI